MTKHVITFGQASVETVERTIEGEPLISEAVPHQVIQNYYTDATEQLNSGVWTSTKGQWHAFSGRSEFCHILEGKVCLTDKDGNATTYVAGDSFQIAPEFDGTWEVLEDAKKVYVLFEDHKK